MNFSTPPPMFLVDASFLTSVSLLANVPLDPNYAATGWRNPPPEVLIKQQTKVLFWDIENMISLFTSLKSSDHQATLDRCYRRFKLHLGRIETFLREVQLSRENLAKARNYRSQLLEMVWAMEELLGVKVEGNMAMFVAGTLGVRARKEVRQEKEVKMKEDSDDSNDSTLTASSITDHYY